jgi:hypothetical protein
MRKCGNCGETGHNRRTCTQLEVIEEVEQEEEEEVVVVEKPKKKRKQRCRACGEEDDHTAKNCPYKPIPADADIGPKRMDCGHWSWWKQDDECTVCTKAIFFRDFDEEEQEAA